jgi:simple sugar transport system ATP-binding protein
VDKRFGPTVALDAVDIAIAPGQSHALVGRNGAGKSTLVALLTGLSAPDGGEIRLGGQAAPPLTDRQAWRARVACVYQRSTIIPTLSVAENLYINRQPTDGRGLIRWSAVRRQAAQLLAEYQVDVDPAAPAAQLAVEQRQMVEIARALSFGARFIILDEPTAQLDGPAIERLFERIRSLQRDGVTFLYISHHLQEIYEICQTVSVLRDARHVLTSPVAGLDREQLVAAMTGEVGGSGQTGTRSAVRADQAPLLELDAIALDGSYELERLTVKPGEVVGVTGSTSSGAAALGETIAGLRTPTRGRITVGGVPVRLGDVRAALDAGIGFVPQDRHKQGYIPLMSVAENTTMSIDHRLGRFGYVAPARRRILAREMIAALAIKTEGPDQPVAALSGGNQQKVVMARALATKPRVVVLIDPTAGVDVRSRESLLEVVECGGRRYGGGARLERARGSAPLRSGGGDVPWDGQHGARAGMAGRRADCGNRRHRGGREWRLRCSPSDKARTRPPSALRSKPPLGSIDCAGSGLAA